MIKTYKYKLYRTKKLKNLHRLINISAQVYNHSIALHKRYYKLYNKSLNKFVLQKHITKLKKLSKYNYWNELGSQAIQEITERIDKGYKKFFRHENKRPPTFRKKSKYKSFALKGTVGYKINGNILIINKKHYKLWFSREIDGDIKTLTVKRDTLGDIYILITLDNYFNPKHTTSGKSVGMDFGLKTFLTMYNGNVIDKKESPLYFLQSINRLRLLNRRLSSKKKGSNNRKQSKLNLARLHRKISNQRSDFFFKLARDLSQYDNIFIEDLNLKGMQMLWGRKVSDMAYNKFVNVLSYKSNVVRIDRFYPSSKKCSNIECGYINKDLKLSDREWICPKCHTHHDRDINAAKNIYAEGFRVLREGTSSLGVGGVRPVMQATAVDTRIPCL
ncbi:MAG: RNA-guided endonuclease InsQ/TnpB family protein [bacterium]